MNYERQKLLNLAHALGHASPEVWECASGGFFAACSCGWESPIRPTFVDALGLGVAHALRSATPLYRQLKTSGRPEGQLIKAARAAALERPRIRPEHPHERLRRAA